MKSLYYLKVFNKILDNLTKITIILKVEDIFTKINKY